MKKHLAKSLKFLLIAVKEDIKSTVVDVFISGQRKEVNLALKKKLAR